MTVALTRHGEQRLGERLEVAGEEARRRVALAWEEGATRGQYGGAFRLYLDTVARGVVVRVYRFAVYAFDRWHWRRRGTPLLVTCWPVPRHLRAAANRPIPSSVAGAASGAGVDPDARHPDTDPMSREIGPSAGSLPSNPTTAPSSLAARERLPERMDLSRLRAQGGER